MIVKGPVWILRKFSGTVIDNVLLEVILFTLIATMVVVISKDTDVNLGISNQLLSALGIVLGLVISFRTSSAYDGYQEGRKMWTNLAIMSKNLAQMIWIHVPDDRPAAANQTVLESIIEKRTMINIIHAYAVSVKHLLRDELGIYYEDLYPLIAFLPKYANNPIATQGDPTNRLPRRDESNHLVDPPQESTPPSGYTSRMSSSSYYSTHSDTKYLSQLSSLPVLYDTEARRGPPVPITNRHPLKPAQDPPLVTIYDYIPALDFIRWTIRKLLRRPHPGGKKKRRRKKVDVDVETHIPLELSLVLSNYSAWLMKNGLVQSAIASALTTSLASLQDTVSNLERISTTPLPFAYQVHLRMSVWLYLTFLPFQLYLAFGVITIPATALTALLFLGFLEIGQAIENPFNYGENDLDLDRFCSLIQRDLNQITASVHPEPSTFIFTSRNHPFAPADPRSAEELTRPVDYRSSVGGDSEVPISSARKTLVSRWKVVDDRVQEKEMEG